MFVNIPIDIHSGAFDTPQHFGLSPADFKPWWVAWRVNGSDSLPQRLQNAVANPDPIDFFGVNSFALGWLYSSIAENQSAGKRFFLTIKWIVKLFGFEDFLEILFLCILISFIVLQYFLGNCLFSQMRLDLFKFF